MFDGQACVRPGMKDTGLRKKVISQLFDPTPGHPILLAPTSERAAPKICDAMPECVQCTTVGRHRMVCKEAGCNLPQPFPLLGDWLMHSPLHLLLDFLERRCGSLLLHRIGLAPTTHCRSPGALRKILDTTARSPRRSAAPFPVAFRARWFWHRRLGGRLPMALLPIGGESGGLRSMGRIQKRAVSFPAERVFLSATGRMASRSRLVD